MKNISVENAIKRAWLLRWLGIVITVVPPFIVMIYVGVNDLNPWYVLYGYIMFFVVGFVFANFTTLRWRIWAFSNVRNVHLLRKLATEDYFIHDGKKWIEKFEFPSHRHKAEWARLQEKFEMPLQITEDFYLPSSVFINRSRIKIITNSYLISLILPMLSVLAFFLDDDSDTPLKYVLLIFCLLALFTLFIIYTERRRVKSLFDKDMSIYVDNKGITWDTHNFYGWREIMHETVVPHYIDDQRGYEIRFMYNSEYVHIPLRHYKTSRIAMLNILQTFRIRSGYK